MALTLPRWNQLTPAWSEYTSFNLRAVGRSWKGKPAGGFRPMKARARGRGA